MDFIDNLGVMCCLRDCFVQTSRFSETKLPIWCLNLRSSIVINLIDIEVY